MWPPLADELTGSPCVIIGNTDPCGEEKENQIFQLVST
jgi:hypothetical protein